MGKIPYDEGSGSSMQTYDQNQSAEASLKNQ